MASYLFFCNYKKKFPTRIDTRKLLHVKTNLLGANDKTFCVAL